eukprot:COSAG02_NODE_202_length_29305_cov_20.432377_10_plen_63_part_00
MSEPEPDPSSAIAEAVPPAEQDAASDHWAPSADELGFSPPPPLKVFDTVAGIPLDKLWMARI